MRYYEVALGVKRHWKSATFTYAHDEIIPVHTLVRVPFGKQKKIGYVTAVVKKPPFATKELVTGYNATISNETVAFLDWYRQYYGLGLGQALAQLFPDYLTATKKVAELIGPTDSSTVLELTTAQKQAVKELYSTQKPSVLHGITGAGKTRVYLELLKKTLKQKKNALLLYPEIALTSQIVTELSKHAKVAVFHSQLSDAERSKLWYTVLESKEPHVVVGPRSALFLPHKNLGLIIIDEAHETTYKQENDPRYHALYVAAGLSNSHNAKLVLGSATPPISETERVLQSGGNLVCLHEKAIREIVETKMSVIDMKDRTQFKRHPIFSNTLINEVSEALQQKKQSLLFLNRRGTSKLVMCSSDSCEWVAECASCELALTYHHDENTLVCHTCGRKTSMPTGCPVCSSALTLKSLGSKAIVEEVAHLFPGARLARYDSDTSFEESFNESYEAIVNGSVDILIGTQQLIKGLDLPKLAVIGLVNSDLSLRFPDYSSDERTFQLVTQAIGRVGRGHTYGSVIVQTYQSHNPVLRDAIAGDWHSFREKEHHDRREHGFPPYSFIGKVIFRESSYNKAINSANAYKKLLSDVSGIVIEGPVPSFHHKRGRFYYVQLHLRAKSRKVLLQATRHAPDSALFDLDPITLL